MKFLKAVIATVVAATGALVVALGPAGNTIGQLDATTWIVAALTVLGSGGLVAYVENIEGTAGNVAKGIVSFLSAGLASLVVALNDNHITQAEWLIAFSAAVAATGLVYQVKNQP